MIDVWTCMSHRPGIRYFPRPSITRAPAGMRVVVPTLSMRVPRTITVWFARGVALGPSMMVTWVKAIGVCAGAAFPTASAAAARRVRIGENVPGRQEDARQLALPGQSSVDWQSAERMRSVWQYEMSMIVGYNAPRPAKGRGPSIFLHIWDEVDSHPAGGTAL